MKLTFLSLSILLLSFSAQATAEVDFKKAFSDRDACFLVTELESGKAIAEYNQKRCKGQFTPCSSFKVAAALMGFEKGVLKDENQVIKWDGVKRDRPELNQDQTPFTWMSNSAKWVTEWIMPQVGMSEIQHFLNAFEYGNKDFSGGLKDSWVSSSLKISAYEQMAFISKLWQSKLPLSQKSMDLTKKIIFIKKIGDAELYGKTGTGCLVGHDCMEHPGKMLGWFVGALKKDSKTYIVVANASDLKDQKQPGGPRTRNTTIDILKEMRLTGN